VGNDFARKENVGRIKHTPAKNVNIPGDEARDRLAAIKAWVRDQVRPPVTQQRYED